ncbi:uncharacterized protein LOC110735371 [Chenopodium quinoa]|uniref:uncharacterized protein LOC110735371 n=1 Tax=Chenopodium quinoa TaxID=63459 RepID=UPI000B78F503|nr:uncharacterized protein LOC110735371 [Chenopodium quinoa]
MVKKGNIAHYRERLDETLASDNLIDEKKLKTLVKDQILRSLADNKAIDNIDYITEKRTVEVSNFLEMLRSASENYNASSHETHHTTWKLKQDTEDFRVMYREGPVGSPFHSLLVEGYIDAPLDACLCVSWESTLYPRWFPETLIPTFKVAEAKKLQKVRIGEEISLVRVKLSWPLSSREALLHYFEFEYFENDLIVVLLNTISNADNIQNETHGFTNEGIPKADNTVRIDLVGGFALQKVTENRSYFRTIGNLDIKLDFVPPSLINFISRQLIGSGFRFYKKTVASVSNGDEAFSKVLSDPLYSRIRQAVYSKSKSESSLKEKQTISDYTGINDGEQKTDVQNAYRKEDEKILSNENISKPLEGSKPISNEIEEEEIKESNGHVSGYLMQDKLASEIEEEGVEGNENEFVNNIKDAKESRGSIDQPQSVDFHNNVPISPQVERALGTLDKLISVVKENRRKGLNGSQSGPKIEEEGAALSSTLGKQMNWVDKQGTSVEENDKATAHVSRNDLGIDNMRFEKSDLQAQEENSQVVPPDQNPAIANWSIHAPSAGNSPVAVSSMNREANGIHEDKKKTGQQKKWRLCCFHIPSARLVS